MHACLCMRVVLGFVIFDHEPVDPVSKNPACADLCLHHISADLMHDISPPLTGLDKIQDWPLLGS